MPGSVTDVVLITFNEATEMRSLLIEFPVMTVQVPVSHLYWPNNLMGLDDWPLQLRL